MRRRPSRSGRLGLAFTACLLAALPLSPQATTLQRLETRDLAVGSQEIVVGQVESTQARWNDAHTRILTDVTVRVSRALKGAPGERVVLTQLGGELDGIRYEVPGCPVFRPGEEALLFLWRDSRGRAQVNGLAQGKFEIRRDPRTGEALVQRAGAGLAVQDLKNLNPPARGQAEPRLLLSDLVREIQRTLAEEGGR